MPHDDHGVVTARPSATTGEHGAAVFGRLLTSVAAGDAAAFATLYDLIVDDAMAVIRLVRPEGDAVETLHEAMVEIWRSAPRLLDEPARLACLLVVYRTAGRSRGSGGESEAASPDPDRSLERSALALGLVCRARLGRIAVTLNVTEESAAQLLCRGLRDA